MLDRYGPSPADARAPWALDFRLTPGSVTRALIIILAAWVLQSFLQAMLAACVTAVASWPLYTRFANRMPRAPRAQRDAADLHLPDGRVRAGADGVCLRRLARRGAHANSGNRRRPTSAGIALPPWLENVPLFGPWVLARWQSELAHPGTLMLWAQRTDPALLLDGAITRSVHGPPRDHHRLHEPAAVLLLSGR